MAVICMLGIFDVVAFDSAEWLGKREMLSREAERLQSAYTNCVAHLSEPGDDITIPVETFPDGSVKTIVHADKAQVFLAHGLIWAQGVTIQKMDSDGVVNAKIVAENCVIDRFTKSGWAEGPATVTHGKTVFRGEGIYFSSPESYVMVTRGADIESKDLKFGGVAQ